MHPEKPLYIDMAWDVGTTKQHAPRHVCRLGDLEESRTAAIICLLCVALLWYLYTTFIYTTFFSELRDLPASRSYLPLIRWGPTQFSPNRGEVFYRMSKTIPNNGLIRFQGFWDREYILLTSPQAINEVIVQRSYDFVKPSAAKRVFDRFLGTSFLFVTEGAHHRHTKSIMQAPFSLRKIRGLYPLMWSRAMLMTETRSLSARRSDDGEILADLDAWAHEATLDVIIRATFGEEFGDAAHKAVLPKLSDIVIEPTWQVQAYFTMCASLPYWMLKFAPGGISTHFQESSRRLRQTVKDFVEERRASMGGEDSDILIQIMERNAYDDDDLVGHILGLLMAGIDPTTAGFTWVIWFLAINPHWQSQLRHELHRNIAFEDFDKDALRLDLMHILEELPILDAVCNEALRLRPPSPTVSRVSARDTIVMGHPVRKGTRLLISPYMNNLSEEFWGADATSFNPGRWLEARDQKNWYRTSGPATASHSAFMPFLHGPRKCIGHIYSQAEIRVFVASLVGKYEFQMANGSEKVEPAGVLTSKPKHGLKLRLRPVQPWRKRM